MNYNTFVDILNKFPQLPYKIYLTGGEPTLNKDFIKMVDYLKKII